MLFDFTRAAAIDTPDAAQAHAGRLLDAGLQNASAGAPEAAPSATSTRRVAAADAHRFARTQLVRRQPREPANVGGSTAVVLSAPDDTVVLQTLGAPLDTHAARPRTDRAEQRSRMLPHELDQELCRLKRAIAALKQSPECTRPLLKDNLPLAHGAAVDEHTTCTVAVAGSVLSPPSLADHLARTSRVDDAGALSAAAARMTERSWQLRAAANAAHAAYTIASAELDARMSRAAAAGQDICDADAKDALDAAAAADAADAAAAQSEELAAAMAAAAGAAAREQKQPPKHAMHPVHSINQVEPRLRCKQPEVAPRSTDGGLRSAQRTAALARRRVRAATTPVPETPKPFRAQPVPASTSEPRYERLMQDAALVREQRRLESIERLRASERPFSFYQPAVKDQVASARTPQRTRAQAALVTAAPRPVAVPAAQRDDVRPSSRATA